jgi:putative pyoverdin transport system ATP-binding/permease protein
MRFLKLLIKELSGSGKNFLYLMIISALSTALLIAVLNVSMVSSGLNKIIFAGAYILLLVSYIYFQYQLIKKGWRTAEEIVYNFRKRLSKKILNADYYSLEKIGDKEIFERLTQETANISQSAGFLIPSIQTMVLLLFIFVYIGIISFFSMIVFLILISISFYLYRSKSQNIILLLKRATKSEIRFYGFLNDILKGLKEIKTFTARKTGLLNDIKSTSSFLRKLKQKSYLDYSDLSIYAQAFFFLIIGVTIFIIPKIRHSEIETIIKLVTTAFFVMGPSLTILFMLPMYEKVDMSLEFLEALETKLDSIAENINIKEKPVPARPFENIEVKGLQFDYNGKANGGFRIVPIDFIINKNEIIFFTGGNGSGKTTLLKVISSIYKKTGGDIFINGKAVNEHNLEEYRNNFSGIFSDFHLFSKLYGFDNPDKQKIDELLSIMKIENKTALDKDTFSNLNLSTGQKKRLALVVSLFEDRQIMIFDEWAAEQDQYFREYFFTDILPELKRKGKTVLVVSHDERYFGIADKVVKMDLGRIIEIKVHSEIGDRIEYSRI